MHHPKMHPELQMQIKNIASGTANLIALVMIFFSTEENIINGQ